MITDDELRAQVDAFPWYHTIDLGNGVCTPGMFDHRGTEDRHLLPADLSGLRCLDVGTMDGFWAFAMEQRGAKEVVALDIEDPSALDWPASLRPKVVKTLDETKARRFALVREALGSSVERVPRSVYELDDDLGHFDLVFCGDLLVHLKDPVTALERLRRVCRGTAVVCNPVQRFVGLGLGRRPLAQFDGIDEFAWWVTNLAGLRRMALAAGFGRVELGRPFNVRATAGGPWKGRRGAMRAYP
ncbi:MAG TPA: class I SAM-dependent methyltransferase [Acidimicrobiales bacterium]|nr:class I SAM-dependent methyltransferase [Acidimicrobiales bacterium]